jgi:hypothetical protein
VVLLVILVLNVYKPRGMTRYGWRKQHPVTSRWDRELDRRHARYPREHRG